MTQSTLTHCYHLIHVCHNDTKYIDTLLSSYTCVSHWHKVHWHIVIILYMCVTMTQSTLTHCYHLIHVCHNDTKYIDTLLSSYTCVSQWHKVHWHIVIILYLCVPMTQITLTHCYHVIPVCHNDPKYIDTLLSYYAYVCHNDTKYIDTLLSSHTCVSQWHKVQWHIVIILYLCVPMRQSTLIHCYHLIHVCHNDTKYIDTLLSSYTCVSQWHKVHWHIVIILYTCATMTQITLTHCYHLIHMCHNDTQYIDTLLSSYTCVSQWHKVQWHIAIILYLCVPMRQSTVTYSYHVILVCHNDTTYLGTLISSNTHVSQWHKVHRHIVYILYLCVTMT